MKNINTRSLQNLCSVHSVVGDTTGIINYLQKELQKRKIKSQITDFGLLVFGNTKNPKTMMSAHVDEVGFQIVKRNENNTFLVKKAGHVDAVMLNNAPVYIQTAKSQIDGMFYPHKDLGDNKPDNYTEIFLDTMESDKISVGDFGSYKRQFFDNNEKIMATGLDNKMGAEMILELVDENPKLLKDVLFAFVTEEEITYDCIGGLSALYKPQYALVLDMMPNNQTSPNKVEVLPEFGKGPGIILAMHSYNLHPLIREKLKKVKTPYQNIIVDINFPPEPEAMQRNGVTKGINILLPMFGWHNSMYTMYKKDFLDMKKFVLELNQIFAK